MTEHNISTSSTADRELAATRIFDAPRALVFKMFTDPNHVIHWWGPIGFTNTIHEMDVRPGGVWRLTMHGPDGVDYPNMIRYIEVVEPERLVYEHSDDDGSGNGIHCFHVTVTFEDIGGKTRLTMRSLFPTAQQRELVVVKFGADKGLQQTLDRLREYLQNH